MNYGLSNGAKLKKVQFVNHVPYLVSKDEFYLKNLKQLWQAK